MEKNPIILSDRLYRVLTTDNDRSEHELKEILNEGNRDLQLLVENLHDKEYVDEQLAAMKEFDTDSAWRDLSMRLSGNKKLPKRKQLNFRVYLRWISAAVIIISAVIAVKFMIPSNSTYPPTSTAPEIAEDIRSAMINDDRQGLTGAMIQKVVPSKKTITKSQHIDKQPKDKEEVKAVDEMLNATKVTTYYNKEYWLTLSDGTVVHLGRGSRLIYYDKFIGDTRNVYLEGEAYFIVAEDKKHKFVVHTNLASITVYGTQFNVNTRSADCCSVVLVEGSLGITPLSGNEVIITPGSIGDVRGGDVTVGVIDTTPYRAWNTGHVEFDSWALEKVFNVIGRWYGKEVLFTNDDCRSIEISGSFNRYDNLVPTIESISLITGLTIVSDENTIRIGY